MMFSMIRKAGGSWTDPGYFTDAECRLILAASPDDEEGVSIIDA